MKKIVVSFKHPSNRRDFYSPECDISRLICETQPRKRVCLSNRQIEIARGLGWEVVGLDDKPID